MRLDLLGWDSRTSKLVVLKFVARYVDSNLVAAYVVDTIPTSIDIREEEVQPALETAHSLGIHLVRPILDRLAATLEEQ